MTYNHLPATSEQPLTGMGRLERSIATCEELLTSMDTPKRPSAGRTRYLLRVRLSNMRQQLKDMSTDKIGNLSGDDYRHDK
jgi:hypothetical protein